MHFQHRLVGRQPILNRIETTLDQSCDGNRAYGQFPTDQLLGDVDRQLRQGFKKFRDAIGCVLDLLNQLLILRYRFFDLHLKISCGLLFDFHTFGLMRLFQGGDCPLKLCHLLGMSGHKLCFRSRHCLFNPSKNLVFRHTHDFGNVISDFGPFRAI